MNVELLRYHKLCQPVRDKYGKNPFNLIAKGIFIMLPLLEVMNFSLFPSLCVPFIHVNG